MDASDHPIRRRARLAGPGGAAQVCPGDQPHGGLLVADQAGPLANLVPVGLDELASTVRFALKRIQYRPELVDGCLAETGLVIHPP